MSRGRFAFRQRDVVRLVGAAKAAGLEVTGLKFDVNRGTVEVVTGDRPEQDSLDKELAEFQARYGQG